jgi:hypothetical protein
MNALGPKADGLILAWLRRKEPELLDCMWNALSALNGSTDDWVVVRKELRAIHSRYRERLTDIELELLTALEHIVEVRELIDEYIAALRACLDAAEGSMDRNCCYQRLSAADAMRNALTNDNLERAARILNEEKHAIGSGLSAGSNIAHQLFCRCHEAVQRARIAGKSDADALRARREAIAPRRYVVYRPTQRKEGIPGWLTGLLIAGALTVVSAAYQSWIQSLT